MCGITGIWSQDPFRESTSVRERLRSMAATLSHRGPDDSGVWSDARVGLGHTRLAIIDLTATGHQPMHDVLDELHIVFNGEIYNFPALRHELIGLGHRFASRSDTEVILNGYRQWGDAVIDRLRGMFAFALWDSRRRRLLLARDRVGKKPLYYTWHQDLLVFGSEIKAILAWPGIPRVPDTEAIHHYLTLRYVPTPLTAFAGIRALPPAHRMTVESDRSYRIERYWDLPMMAPAPDRSVADLKKELVERFDEAVRLRLISDVPVGAFLSGGVDSASVVASMARVASGSVRTFTVGFSETAVDERADARLVADAYGTDHSDFVIQPHVMDVLPRLVWHYGQPFSDPVAIPSFYLSEIARRHVKVVLNGDGGDENFFGYRRHAGARLSAWLDQLPLVVRQQVARLGHALPLHRASRGFPVRLRQFMLAADQPWPARYGSWVSYFPDSLKEQIYGDGLRDWLPQRTAAAFEPWFVDGASPEDCAAWADIHTFLPDDLLVRIDVAAMAHGLEGRSPFLDQEIMAFAARIPASQKMRGIRTKSLLRSAMEGRLPRRLLYQPKRGFPMPLTTTIARLGGMIRETLLSEKARSRGLFRPDRTEQILAAHFRGERNRSQEIWTLLLLELWYDMWIDRDDAAREQPAPPVLDMTAA